MYELPFTSQSKRMRQITQKIINRYYEKTGVLPVSARLLEKSLKEYVAIRLSKSKVDFIKIKSICSDCKV